LELDVVNRCYSDLLTTAQAPEETGKRLFTDEEIDTLWEMQNELDFTLLGTHY